MKQIVAEMLQKMLKFFKIHMNMGVIQVNNMD